MAQTRPSPTLSRGFTRLGRFLAPDGVGTLAAWQAVRHAVRLGSRGAELVIGLHCQRQVHVDNAGRRSVRERDACR